jgi:hypothetical protein
MLVKCPRCGFSQPKDQYCAQCGIDMTVFKPPRQSAFKRYATDPLMYLLIALVVIGVSITTLYKKDKANLAQRVQFLKGGLQMASTNGRNLKAEAVARQAPSPSTAAAETATPAATAAVAAAAPATPPATATVAVASGTTTAYIYYAEVPRRSLERLYEESQATGQFNSFGDYTAGILPEVEKRITAPGLKIHILEKSAKTITKNQQWFTGIHDTEFDEDMGLSTFIELAESDSNVFRGNLEIVRSLREVDSEKTRGLAAVDPSTAAPAPQKSSYPAIFEIGPGSGFFISGVLPRKTRVAHEEELSRKGPFEVLRSPAFQNKETEFVIFIEFEKKP